MTTPRRTGRTTPVAGRTTPRATPGRTAAGKRDYSALAAERIGRPADKPDASKYPSQFIYARNKKGKTHYALRGFYGIEQTLVLDPEAGTDEFIESNPHVYPITKWEDMNDAYMYLRHGNHNYTTVSLDGLTRINNFALKWIMGQMEEMDLSRKPGMVQKQDYGKSGEIMKSMLYNFHTLPMAKIYTAQERSEDGSDFSDDDDVSNGAARFVPDLPKGVRAAINGQVDVIGRLYVVKIQRKDGTKFLQRRLWVEPNDSFDTGYRSDYEIPPYIKNPTPARVVKLMREGM